MWIELPCREWRGWIVLPCREGGGGGLCCHVERVEEVDCVAM